MLWMRRRFIDDIRIEIILADPDKKIEDVRHRFISLNVDDDQETANGPSK
jgi:hypothetical protein